MEVELLYFEGCPGWRVTQDRLRLALAEAGVEGAAVSCREVTTPEQAEAEGFRGSPTVLLDGADPFASPEDPPGLACRVYRTPEGLADAPTVEQLVSALRDASART